MSGKSKHAYPFYIISGTLICLILLSVVRNTFSFNGFTFRPLNVLSDLQQSDPPPPAEKKVVTAAMRRTATPGQAAGTAAVLKYEPPADFMSYTGIINYPAPAEETALAPGMQHFVQALTDLRQGQRKKVRIAYFGDSMIEGDLITEDLRDSLQATFGGMGVGFVPATSIVATYRTTILHSFSGNWKDYHYKNNPPEDVMLGISGHTFIPGADSWIKYTPVKKPHLNRFDEVSILYGPAEGNSAVVVNDRNVPLGGNAAVNMVTFKQDTATPGLLLKCAPGMNTPLYGLCFESDSGVFVDNYSFRGISGVELAKLSSGMLQHLQQQRPYDLIVLHYGANVLWRPELTDYSWYERPMAKVMDSLRHRFPNTSFLIISTADKSYRKGEEYVTAPGVAALIKVQHDMAERFGTGYWNLFAAMGGEGAMTRWVEGDTVLANKDYTHFNRQGASRVGALLYKAIRHEFEHPAFSN